MKKSFWLFWASVILVLAAVAAPRILTLPAVCEKCDFTTTGSIGDTIGGLTAPVIGLLNAMLLFYTINKQNDDLHDQREKESLNKYLDHLVKSIDNYVYVSGASFTSGRSEPIIQYGSAGIASILETIYCSPHEYSLPGAEEQQDVAELISILEICDLLLDKLSTSNNPDKSAIWTLTHHQFRYRIYPKMAAIGGDFLNQKWCENCSLFHGLPIRMSTLIRNICQKLSIALPPEASNS